MILQRLLLTIFCLFLWQVKVLYGGSSDCSLYIHEDNLVNENGEGRAFSLVDEQHINFSWTTHKGGIPENFVDYASKKFLFPASTVIDLNEGTYIKEIALFVRVKKGEEDQPIIKIFTGKPFNWSEKYSSLSLHSGWNVVPVNQFVNFLKIEVSSPSIRLFEAKFNSDCDIHFEKARLLEGTVPERTIGDFIGINAFVDDPPGLFSAVGWIREYHNWYWTDLSKDSLYFPNNVYAYSNARGFDFDKFYYNCDANNKEVVPCIKGTVEPLRPKHWLRLSKPVYKSFGFEDPANYEPHADQLFNYAYRYGKKSSMSYVQRLNASETELIGKDYIRYVENWNEPDTNWDGEHAHFTPFEYAALSSADYDGHLGNLEISQGLVGAKAGVKMVMAGTAGLKLEYLKAIKLWCDYHRDGSLPYDVINMHFTSRYNKNNVRYALSAEEDSIQIKVKEISSFMGRNGIEKPLWLSEFAYDQSPKSPQGLPETNAYSSEEAQAIAILRTYLVLSGTPVEKVALYMLRDVSSTNDGVFASSGIVQDKKQGWKKKTAWYYLNTLHTHLEHKYLDKKIVEGKDDLYCYRFKSKDGKIEQYVYWMATLEGKQPKKMELTIAGPKRKVVNSSMSMGAPFGIQTLLASNASSYSLLVEEKPKILTIYRPETEDEKFSFPHPIDGSRFVLKAEDQKARSLVDENSEFLGVLHSTTQNAQTVWNSYKNESYPKEAIIEMDKHVNLSWIAYFCASNNGAMKLWGRVDAESPWSLISNEELRLKNRWVFLKVETRIKELKVEMTRYGSRISELIMYEQRETSL